MVVCKYYRQGNCRYGQYCQFEHINTFGANNKVDSYTEDEYIVVLVAKEMLNAERGGQWLLSCFAPLKDKPCIPGMEDLSPEEVRWEMYQAQNNGMVEQAKLHFQQLCRDMKAKRDVFKNPSRETLTKLKELLGTGHKNTRNDNAPGKPSSFAFATPQLGLPSSTSSSNVFGNKTFGNQSNPFGGSFTSTSNTSIFGRSTTTSNPVFGQNTQTFGSSGSIFSGGTSQPVFGQPSIFGTNNQVNNVFARHQTSQTPISTTNSIFGSTPSTGAFSSGIFSPETPAFGGAPVFSGSSTFGNNSSIFGEKPTFGSSSSIFGGTNTATPAFSSAQSTNAFGVTTSTPSGNIFGNVQGNTPPMSTSSASPFGVTSSTTTSPFATAVSQFEATSTAAFSTFGMNTGTVTTASSSSTPFGTTNTGVTFGTPSTSSSPFTSTVFSDMKNSPDDVYSLENQLTDDEKSMYMAEKFTFGKVPLKPPTKEIS
ncbi:Nucleoporin-like protein amo1 [Melipona quadrifasciata]|uniref:Nucleoporin NUP42 n=1 Tax=Melipona quadrifasciata TaxID=166423 RepID=A0A0M9A2Z8_9HYME|nr:Nucleoporin-like protein amo1 [Melipona quadrifasciata]